jgi:hypothetical protein
MISYIFIILSALLYKILKKKYYYYIIVCFSNHYIPIYKFSCESFSEFLYYQENISEICLKPYIINLLSSIRVIGIGILDIESRKIVSLFKV